MSKRSAAHAVICAWSLNSDSEGWLASRIRLTGSEHHRESVLFFVYWETPPDRCGDLLPLL
jgi:hypothetical protein